MRNFFFQEKSVKISPSIVIFSVLFILSLYFLFYIRSVLVMLFAAVIIMAALNSGVNKLERWFRIPRALGIFIMYVLVITALSLIVWLVVPPLASELQNLTRYSALEPVQQYLKEFKFTLTEIQDLMTSFGGSVSAVFELVTFTFSGIFTFFTILVMSSYLLIDRNSLHKKIGWFTQDRKHLRQAKEFVDTVESELGGWVRGQLILMTVIGVFTYIGLSLLGIPYALPLAVLAGFLEILPNIGPTIAALPAIVLAFALHGWVMAGVTGLFYILMQQLENNIIVPRIMKANVDVNPLATIVTILVGLKVGGVIGALLAVPVYITLRTVYGTWFRNS